MTLRFAVTACRTTVLVLTTVLATVLTTGCSPSSSPTSTPYSAPTTAAARPSTPGRTPPPWLGTRILPTDDPAAIAALRTPRRLRERAFTLPDTLDPLSGRGFRAVVESPAPSQVIARSTWNPACPVAAQDLAWIRLTFRGFDGARHTGELLVNAAVADDLVSVFRDLWRARFPMEQLAITTRAERDADPTGDGNGTGAFNCRPVTGGSSYSEHAYGLAVDLNPFQNPYAKGAVVLPELARSYLDRGRRRPGVITADGPVVRAFDRIGWGWGGDWRTLKDYQHFSATDR
ncbi:M15 family metallopeptidase [Nocardioides sp. 616]|uniref:M15 family metallopeptidase n=1 Tax=Nocardioides sp. 616 TaxID=2268090 RepID=UPI000CE3F1E6|nr:M15 family metallopeptidase [Nocardioides sp. 616]